MDTSVAQFYPTLFVLATDIMDMLGDMVWERIRRRAEFSEDGTLICSLPGLSPLVHYNLDGSHSPSQKHAHKKINRCTLSFIDIAISSFSI